MKKSFSAETKFEWSYDERKNSWSLWAYDPYQFSGRKVAHIKGHISSDGETVIFSWIKGKSLSESLSLQLLQSDVEECVKELIIKE